MERNRIILLFVMFVLLGLVIHYVTGSLVDVRSENGLMLFVGVVLMLFCGKLNQQLIGMRKAQLSFGGQKYVKKKNDDVDLLIRYGTKIWFIVGLLIAIISLYVLLS